MVLRGTARVPEVRPPLVGLNGRGDTGDVRGARPSGHTPRGGVRAHGGRDGGGAVGRCTIRGINLYSKRPIHVSFERAS